MSLTDTPSATSSPVLASGASRCGWLAGLIADPYGRDHVLASLSAAQAKVLDFLTSGTSGQPGSTSSSSAALQLCLESRLRARTQSLGSTLFKMTWKQWVTPSGRSRFRLRASGHRTSETGFTGWPTPNAGPQNDGDTTWQARREVLKAKHGNGNGFGMNLGQAVTLATWPTPRREDSESTGAHRGKPDTLHSATQLAGWLSPTSGSPNSLRGKGQDPAVRKAGGHAVNLQDQVTLTHGPTLPGLSAATEKPGQLNAAFSLWLMGYPVVEWLSVAPFRLPKEVKSAREYLAELES